MNPLVSILTPSYNHAPYLEAYFQSVLAQSYPHWEILLMNDGSTDATLQIAERYAKLDGRIRVFSQENQGMWKLGHTYNTLLAQAKGSLVAILDSDDVWVSHKLQRQIPLHLESGAGLSFGQFLMTDKQGRLRPDPPYPALSERDPRKLVQKHLLGHYFLTASTVVMNRDALEKVGGFRQLPDGPVTDFPTMLRVGIEGGFLFIPEVLAYWRQTPSQSTWRYAREIAYGVYGDARRVLAEGHFPELSEPDLLSYGRRTYMAQANYRAAAMAWDRGDHSAAWEYARHTLGLGKPDIFAQCLSMFSWKTLRRTRSVEIKGAR